MNTRYEQIAQVVRSRQTLKVLADPAAPVSISQQAVLAGDAVVAQAVADAGWAPFHYDRKVNGIAEPWRAYMLPQGICRELASQLPAWFSDLKPGNKMPAMLSACGSVVLVTWLPQTQSEIRDTDKLRQVNDEHLAAAAAMVQNLLLLLQAAGYGSYWSSGGKFCDSSLMRRLGIDAAEQLIAAVYVEYPETQDQPLQRIAGSHRKRRSPAHDWFRKLTEHSHE